MTSEHICDGCGQRVDADHVRQRIARLERATSFRPIHIATLLLWHAPPPRLEDYFYSAAAGGERGAEWAAFFERTLQRCGIASDGRTPGDLLTDLQRQGFFVADCVECPLPVDAAFAERLLMESAATVIKRIQYSYKPKAVVVLGEARKLLGALRESDYVMRLLKD